MAKETCDTSLEALINPIRNIQYYAYRTYIIMHTEHTKETCDTSLEALINLTNDRQRRLLAFRIVREHIL